MKAEVGRGYDPLSGQVGGRVMQKSAHSAPSMVYKFPGVNCISLNDETVPEFRQARVEGDIVKLDVTLERRLHG
jgi:methionyl aminopeptidase